MNQFTPPSSTNSQQEPLFPGFPTLDVAGILGALKSKFWLMAGIFSVFVGAALVYVMVAPKVYQSVATVEVQTQRMDEIQGDRSFDATKIDLDRLNSLAANLTNATAIIDVVDALDLRDNPDFLEPVEGGYADAEIVELMAPRVMSELERGSRLIHISVQDKDPQRAHDLALQFVKNAEVVSLRTKSERLESAMKLLEEQRENQLKKIDKAETELQAFRKKHPTLRLENEEKEAPFGNALTDLTKLLSESRSERVQAEADLAQLEEMGMDEPEKILDIGNFKDQKHISDLLVNRAWRGAEFNKIRKQFKPGHPTYDAYMADLEGFDQQVREAGLQAAQTIQKRVETTRKREEQMTKLVNQEKEKRLVKDGVMKDFRTLHQAVNASYKTYENILEKINNEDATSGLSDQEIVLADAPVVPVKPVSPKKKITVIFAGMLGGMAGLGLVLVLHLLDRSLKSRRQTESTLGLTVMAEIPLAFTENWDLKESLFVTREPTSLAAEGFRALRTALSALSPRSVMITSATPEDGKSFCAANLALLQAQFGYRTLLVDADFRRPSLAKALVDPAMNQSTSNHGLSVQNICQPTPYENLWLITCSQFAPNGSETMSGEHFAGMLWEAYRSFDCVIIDSSPVGVVSDALDFARYADAVLPVIRAGETQAGDAQRMITQLRRMRAPIAGCILNGVTEVSSVQSEYHQDYQPLPRPTAPALGMVPSSSDPAPVPVG